ncbi:GNAT family N-acetyltransferase [Pseudomonas sp. ZM23]|uniref:GNAT family N-acetyltransferase n=1 Tax=Pseudomonas triclosanedens TaxID=2961893 RepID=A0ABY6ZR63_9PSED|nr:GNAT family N-acetyltransferase [Pseudomonas triclosanedens]MCP8466100.1 GNAT family N-acetyltransferase [Pseudomonas triclosanedens]MCP8472335.1 GNAT family N-acetyltransferase [Pseudomonas triclosanedens]MCP8477399.1 GNAT family N-acetyltransferase [Pseudomonas triclosanedens]WAI47266.1 GNAT family N-acetyltransferase [Pseudomonas triclosanedens]
MDATAPTRGAQITFRRISALTVCEVCELSETLSHAQRGMVADNGTSIAEAHFSENAWFRAIYADEALVGFIMLHIGADWDDGIDCPGHYLWRFMIAGPYQGMGFGKQAIEQLVHDLKGQGVSELYTSYGLGDGSPQRFYNRLGFVLTGDHYGDEVEAVLVFDQ